MSDLPFSPVRGTDCPQCDHTGHITAVLGPAYCAKCKNSDCPIRDFWTIAPRDDFPNYDGAVGDLDL